ncbi:hypothetical protein BDI4_1140010 [Burkholderia diffusa]|nr:hypothetical protein BDI4_1140010 [Burkholderia diffusa]
MRGLRAVAPVAEAGGGPNEKGLQARWLATLVVYLVVGAIGFEPTTL